MSTVWAVIVLAGMAASGVAALWRWRQPLRLAQLEVVAFGIPLGVVWSSLALLAIADAFGFNAIAVWLVVIVSLGVAIALSWRDLVRFLPVQAVPVGIVSTPVGEKTGEPRSLRSVRGIEGVRALLGPGIGWVPIVAIGAFAIRWASLWDGALTYEPSGLFAGHINIWGDWAQHIGDVNSFVYGDNFPPEHPRYTGVSYAYHYLASFTAAAMVEVGMGVTQALTFHSFLFSIVVALCVYAFARRLTGDPWSAALGMTLFFLGGGFAWLLVWDRTDGLGNLWDVLRDRPWDGTEVVAHNYEWQNVYFASIEPQRAFLYGLPLCLLTFTLLHSAVQTRRQDGKTARRQGVFRAGRLAVLPLLPSSWPVFAAAGGVAGLLPFAHLGPLPLVAMVCLCLFALFPSLGMGRFRGGLGCPDRAPTGDPGRWRRRDLLQLPRAGRLDRRS